VGDVLEDVGNVLEANRRQYGRVFESPPALVKPYKTAYKNLTGAHPPPDAVYFWKLAKGSDNAQAGKDVAKVAYFAGQLAERERGGGKADVLLFKCRLANYVGMTKLGFECRMHMLKKARPSPPKHYILPHRIHPRYDLWPLWRMQISPKYLLSLRRKPQPSDDYSQQILQWHKVGFTMIPGTPVPLDNIGVLSEAGQKAWVRSRYCDWYLLEQTPGSPDTRVGQRS
jgi:hypothetical protein